MSARGCKVAKNSANPYAHTPTNMIPLRSASSAIAPTGRAVSAREAVQTQDGGGSCRRYGTIADLGFDSRLRGLGLGLGMPLSITSRPGDPLLSGAGQVQKQLSKAFPRSLASGPECRQTVDSLPSIKPSLTATLLPGMPTPRTVSAAQGPLLPRIGRHP